jgi:hypothetical protein
VSKNKVNVKWNSAKIAAQMQDIMLEAMVDMAEAIVPIAQNNAPLENGTLRNSVRVTIGEPADPKEAYNEAVDGGSGEEPVRSRGDPAVVYISFNTPYARRLHENLDWNPRPYKILDRGRDPVTGHRIRKIVDKPPVGGPKYLERAVNEKLPDMNKYIRLAFARHGMKR